MGLLSADYRAHELLVQGARTRAELWRMPVVFGVATVITLIGNQLVWLIISQIVDARTSAALIDGLGALTSPEAMLFLLYGFGILWAAQLGAIALVHRRGFGSLIGEPNLVRRQSAYVGAAFVLLSIVIWLLPPYDLGAGNAPSLDLSVWLSFLIPAMVGVLIQSSAEEVFFRGYLQQQLAARLRAPWIWMGIPSVLFGLAHYAPDTYGGNTWLVVIWAGVFGLALADITARAGSLGPAIVLHFLSNCAALLIVSPQGEMSGLALYHYGFAIDDEAALRALMPFEFLITLLVWLVARLALRR